MHLLGRRLWSPRRIAALAVGVAAVSVLATPAAFAQAPAGPVSPTPASGTPTLGPYVSGHTEQVVQLVQCGGTMYAVGTFTDIVQGGVTYTRDNVFSFSATAPFKITSWAPDVEGIVNSIAFNGSNCADAYIGGVFTSVNGGAAKDIAEISTVTGDVVPAFGNNAGGQVSTLLAVDGHLLAGGYFKSINGSNADPYFTSLNPSTGKNDNFLQLHISGHYEFPGATANPTRVYNQQLSHSGTLDLVEGDFTSVGGVSRQQIFMLNLATDPATVTGWDATGFNQYCGNGHPFYAHTATWSPNDSTVYVATTGRAPHDWNQKFPLTGLCDMAAAFPATQADVSPTWINYTGCWSLYSVAADNSAVYVGGHEEYENNPDGCKSAGKGAVPDPGLGGLKPSTGSVLLNASGTAGLYSRGRGFGADDMLLTRAGLWVASDNFRNTTMCGGKDGHSGICFLPYP